MYECTINMPFTFSRKYLGNLRYHLEIYCLAQRLSFSQELNRKCCPLYEYRKNNNKCVVIVIAKELSSLEGLFYFIFFLQTLIPKHPPVGEQLHEKGLREATVPPYLGKQVVVFYHDCFRPGTNDSDTLFCGYFLW